MGDPARPFARRELVATERIDDLNRVFSKEEREIVDMLIMKKSISTMSHGNRFWLTASLAF